MTRHMAAHTYRDVYHRRLITVQETRFVCDKCGETYTAQGMCLFPPAEWRVIPDDGINGARHTCPNCMKGVS